MVKKLWCYIKANNLQDPANKKNILCDEALFKVFKAKKVDAFSMNKYLSDHLYKKEE